MASIVELIDLVVASPQRAGADAHALLRAGGYADDHELAQLHWVIGRAERESGHLDRARHHLEEAMGLTGTTGDIDMLIGVHSSLAFTLARQGDLDGAEKLLDAAEHLADPVERARSR